MLMKQDMSPRILPPAPAPIGPSIFFVSRHAGAIAWARRYPWGIRAQHVTHLDLARIKPNDVVIGTLPVHLAAQICALGACYFHLCLNVSEGQRGQELGADEMDAAGAELIPYTITQGAPVIADKRATLSTARRSVAPPSRPDFGNHDTARHNSERHPRRL